MAVFITSAAYVDGDLEAEFGKIPPCFLPIGNRPLLYWQAELVRAEFPDSRLTLSLPKSVEIPPQIEEILSKFRVDVVRVADGCTLKESLLRTLISSWGVEEPLTVLHGDTLVGPLPKNSDFVGVARPKFSYRWDRTSDQQNGADSAVWCGVFGFADPKLLMQSLSSESDFRNGVLAYSSGRELQEVEVKDWLDLGHLNSYLDARKHFSTQRSFNRLSFSSFAVEKSSSDLEKMQAEANWFLALPPELKPYTPAIYAAENDSYSIELLPFLPLNDVFVHGNQDERYWLSIYNQYGEWFAASGDFASATGRESVRRAEQEREKLIVRKSRQRLDELKRSNHFKTDSPIVLNGKTFRSIEDVAEDCIRIALSQPLLPGVTHGDPCFSNTLVDTRGGRLRFIDPRGARNCDIDSLYGDRVYDVAKIAHSAIGQYDVIVSGAYKIEYSGGSDFGFELLTGPSQQRAGHLLLERGISGLPLKAVEQSLPTMVLLFLSMLPLHSDDRERQLALLLNGLRLYDEFVKDKFQ